MAIILCLVAGLLPALITPGLLLYFDVSPKVLVLLLGMIAAMIPWLRGTTLLPRRCRFLALAVVLQALAVLLTTALSAYPALSLSGTNWRRFGAVTQMGVLVFTLFACLTMALRKDALLWLSRTVAASGTAIAAYAILQYFGIDPFLPAASYRAGEGIFAIVRPPGTLGHADYLATYLLFVIFCGIALSRTEKTTSLRLAGAGCALVSGLAVIVSGTRSAWLGLAAGLLFLVFRLRPRLRREHAYGAAAVFVLLGAFYLSPAGERLRARVHWIHEDALGGARLLLWRDALAMAGTRWTVGFGPETFGAEFPHYQSAALARQYPDFYHESPHNIFLDTFSEQGILGLAGLLLITGIGFQGAWKIRRDSAGVFPAGALTAMFVSMQFSAFTVTSACFYYLAIAATVAADDAAPLTAKQHVRWPAAVAALILIPSFLWFAVHLCLAEYGFTAVHRDIARGNPAAAAARYRGVLHWQPPGTSYDLPYSRQMAEYSAAETNPLKAAQAGQQALESALRAARYPEERQNAYYHLATLFGSQNDAVNTEQSLRAAISAAPRWFKPHWTLAQLLLLTGRREEALSEAAIAVDLDGNKHPEVKLTLQKMGGDSRLK